MYSHQTLPLGLRYDDVCKVTILSYYGQFSRMTGFM